MILQFVEQIITIQTPVGLDNCISTTSQISGLPSGSLFPNGLTTNVFQVTDTAGNIATCNFYILVNDVESPIITCPQDTSLPFNENCAVEVPDFSNLLFSSDNCGIETIIQSPDYLDTIYSDFTTTFLVTDSAGNFETCSFNVSLFDSYVAELICPDDQSIGLNEIVIYIHQIFQMNYKLVLYALVLKLYSKFRL